MTTSVGLAELENVAAFFRNADYDAHVQPLGRFSRVLLAENPYALIAAVDVDTWDGLEEVASDLQAELTHLARNADANAKRWDLYVILHLRTKALAPVASQLIERIEGDTRFARKFVRINLLRDPADMDRALRPFLPLRDPMPVNFTSPLDVLRDELLTSGLEQQFVETALASFTTSGEVQLP